MKFVQSTILCILTGYDNIPCIKLVGLICGM